MADEKRKGGRKRTGTVVTLDDGRYQAIVTLADGSRRRIPPFPHGTSRKYAEERALFWTEDAIRRGIRRKAKAEKLLDFESDNTEWLEAWIADRVARDQTSTRDSASHYRLHIMTSIGPKHVKDWTRNDLRKLSRELDEKVRAGKISWKTAVNVWGTATRMCSDSCESKLDTLKVRDDNPAAGVRGPDRGIEKGEQFLYPNEFLQFVRCPDVPLKWKRVVSVAIYLYPRDGELRVLDCEETDTEHGNVHVLRAYDRRKREIKATKGKKRRHVPIEPTLLPLLEAMKAEAGERGLLIAEMPSERDMARGFRRWLKKAGVTRRELHEDTPTTRPIRFHDLRATGLTWQAVRGDDHLKIMQRAGHRDFETTQKYIRLAESIREGFGTPFPPLPPELYECRDTDPADGLNRSVNRSVGAKYPKSGGADGTRSRNAPANDQNYPGTANDVTGGPLGSNGSNPADSGQPIESPIESTDPVEAALADAIRGATAAQQWTTAEVLSRELTARREARAGVVRLDAARKQRKA